MKDGFLLADLKLVASAQGKSVALVASKKYQNPS